jgi:hypothetical protein
VAKLEILPRLSSVAGSQANVADAGLAGGIIILATGFTVDLSLALRIARKGPVGPRFTACKTQAIFSTAFK